MIQVAILDDHAVVRRGIREILSAEPDMQVCCEAATAQGLLDAIRKQACDLVVMDITLPGRSGLEVLHELREERPKLPVLVLTIHAEEQFGIRTLKAGAAGYLNKEAAPDELVKAIRKIVGGGRYLTPSLAEALAAEVMSPQDRPLHQTLSNREDEVFRLLASGKTVTDVGRQLALSVKTVSTHRTRILKKLRLTTTAELIRYAILNRLVS
ncbi:MAG: response regulator transcription factor [Nitrospirae bacterium]|nr:MAG: response regulator transcription factor [Nitrospirota bacterium]